MAVFLIFFDFLLDFLSDFFQNTRVSQNLLKEKQCLINGFTHLEMVPPKVVQI